MTSTTNMPRTKAADRWLRTAEVFLTIPSYIEVLFEAEEIARLRGSNRLGKIHCEKAIESLASRPTLETRT